MVSLRYSVFLCAAFAIFACGSTESENTETISINDPEFGRALVQEFDRQGIWYQKISPQIIRYRTGDHERIVELSIEVSKNEHNRNDRRSFMVGSKFVADALESKLIEANVQFTLSKHEHGYLFDWDESQIEAANIVLADFTGRNQE